MHGQLNLVSVGPGSTDLIAPLARAAIARSEVVVGYGLYLKWIAPWLQDKEIHALPLTQERDRAALALKLAREGRTVSLVSSGDIGVYGLAPLVFEMLDAGETTDIQMIPGITAALSCASRLGAPLGHDFATLSLSDLLCPWPWIEDRARLLSKTDLALVLYNVQSETRQSGVYRILDILLQNRPSSTWCGIVRNAYREDETSEMCSLKELRNKKFDMLTSLVIGTRFTKSTGRFLYAPRGYHGWEAQEPVPSGAVWFFTGTRDGNNLAAQCAAFGIPTVISVATEHGAAQARKTVPEAVTVVGRIGESAREKLLIQSNARAVVDASHPFAITISQQLMGICERTHLPYFRFERPMLPLPAHVLTAPSIEAAAEKAKTIGRRIFISTGVKDITTFTKLADRDWFVRITPGLESLESALAAGIPHSQICAMQGPFSKAANETLWTDWKIDCIVTKDSGETGGLPAKLEAARTLRIPLIVVQRPKIHYPHLSHDQNAVLEWIQSLPATT
jgi:precorrin-3B C17-methyltransferase